VYLPEDYSRKSLEKMDIWSIGMILFVMLAGYSNVERNPSMLWDLLNQNESYSDEICLGYDLARKLLELDQQKRLDST